ncbi:methylenetetrahydrofolate reductase [Sphingobium sp. DEHP117]|uniref:methylenetetrahydrofolate reductase n=1 Tax=Sphingobium sp. DEHP117 TaxID=2993436 RepID=UPI0027D51182|nr:methylenetetrahydrofolate reductase [Sphingobium sp. DEHP117]MDQ4419308.1 methylenetetrahydrofolate reductase [Sphingobium sp. DEHP117]
MSIPDIHPNWHRPFERITDGYSLEITGKDERALRDAAPAIPAETPVAVTFLPGEPLELRVAAAVAVRDLDLEPMPHFSARRIRSEDDFSGYLKRTVAAAGVRRAFVVAGDPPQPEGPYADTSALLATGAFEEAGITAIGIGGHPEGHPAMSRQQTWDVLHSKIADIQARGMAALIVTQFCFDADIVLDWLAETRRRGIDVPVRIGVPGPAGIKTLLRFAAHCGVGASTTVLRKYGISLRALVGSAGPDELVRRLEQGLGAEHGKVRLHFYPFGGVRRTADWIADYAAAPAQG